MLIMLALLLAAAHRDL